MTDTPVVQSRHNERGKTDGKRRGAALYNAWPERWQHRKKVCHQKKCEKLINFFRPGHQSTRFQVFSRYSDPAERKVSKLGTRGIVSVLLLVTGQSVIFVIEGCRRDLNGASRQTAL